MARNARKTPEVRADSQADIAFLLLIFFLVATTMNTDTGIARVLPPMPPEDQQQEEIKVKERNLFLVFINGRGDIMAGAAGKQEPIVLSQLKERAKEFIVNPMDDPNLPDAPESAKQAYKERHNLPEYCFCPVPDINLLMLLQYGQSGFWQINIPPVTDLTDYADRLNQRMGVSKAQQTAMMHGFMCEWRGRSMRPELYDENGMPKQNNQRRGEPER